MSYPRRRFDKYWKKHIKQLSGTIGEVILAMNLLQSALFLVFWKLLDPIPREPGVSIAEQWFVPLDQALAIWNVVSSDAVQRDMMLAAAEGLWPATPKNRRLASIKWLKLKADSLGRIRNDAAHLVVDLERTEQNFEGTLVPAEFGAMPPSRLNRMRELKRIEDRFKHVVGDMVQLRNYAMGIGISFHDPFGSWPRKPKLRAVPDQK